MNPANDMRASSGTRLAFLVAGFAGACWAPLVPFAKARLGVDESVFGLLLLCLGVGSVGAMLLTAHLTARHGSRSVILSGSLGLAVLLPLLTLPSSRWTMAFDLILFGASLGSLDVAMNIQAVEVEKMAGRVLMSGFHALFSVGGFAGALLMTLLLSLHLRLLTCTLSCALLMLGATAIASPRLLRQRPAHTGPISIVPHGIVLLLAILAAICFLVEGAVLDWGALLITGMGLVTVAHGGLGYVLFSVAMTIGRLCGDSVVSRYGDRNVLFYGSSVAIAGFVAVIAIPINYLALAGFLLIGFGAANIVPVLVRAAGSQRIMPVNVAVSVITTFGYAGILLGPAMIGFIAKAIGLRSSFSVLAALLSVVALLSGVATKRRDERPN